jgi:hypothetical protein
LGIGYHEKQSASRTSESKDVTYVATSSKIVSGVEDPVLAEQLGGVEMPRPSSCGLSSFA